MTLSPFAWAEVDDRTSAPCVCTVYRSSVEIRISGAEPIRLCRACAARFRTTTKEIARSMQARAIETNRAKGAMKARS